MKAVLSFIIVALCCQVVFAGTVPELKVLSSEWDFGDGTKGEGAKVSHVYTKYGNYKIVLTVDDNTGTECSTSISSFVADVNTPPVAVIKVR